MESRNPFAYPHHCLFLVLALALTSQAAPQFVTKEIKSGIVKGATWIVYGDFNKDGKTDIAAGNHKRTSALLAWYPGPAFAKHHNLNTAFVSNAMEANTSDAAVGDINQDGWPDIVVPTSRWGRGKVFWFENPKGDATGTWKYHEVLYGATNTYHFADMKVADLDKDGKLDIVARDLGGGKIGISDCKFRICYQDNPQTWVIKEIKTHPREGATLQDVDRDGNMDIAGNGFWYRNPGGKLARTGKWIEYNIHKFHYTQDNYGKPPSQHNNSSKIAFGDLNGDKIPDAVLSTAEGNMGYIAWYEGKADPKSQENWVEHKLETGEGPTKTDWQLGHTLRIGDIDGDGDLDIMSGTYRAYLYFPKLVTIWYNNGNAKSWTRKTISDKGIYQGILFDAEDDGDLDIMGAWTNGNPSPIYWYQNQLNPPPDTGKDTTTQDTTQDTTADTTAGLAWDLSPLVQPVVATTLSGGTVTFSPAGQGLLSVKLYSIFGQRVVGRTGHGKIRIRLPGSTAYVAHITLEGKQITRRIIPIK